MLAKYRWLRIRRVLGAIGLFCPIHPSLAHAQASYRLRAETGVEHDTNPARTETIVNVVAPRVGASPAGRLVLGGEASAPVGTRGLISFSGRGAGRAFATEAARADSVGVLEGSASALVAAAERTSLGASLAYYDAFQERTESARDFRSLSPTGQVDQGMGGGRLSLGGGYRLFTFKPDRNLDFAGPRGFLAYRHQLAGARGEDGATPAADEPADWEIGAGLAVEHRTFQGSRCIENDVCPPARSTGARVDDFTALSFELQRTGDFLAGGGGAVHFNASNSFGDTLIRLAVFLKVGVSLPWKLTLSGRAEITTTHYSAKIPLARDRITGLPVASIEDESRNTLRVELFRPLGQRCDVSARYVLYTNELGVSTVEYRRHTFLLAFGVAYEPATR